MYIATCLPACGAIGRWRNIFELVPSEKIYVIEDMSTEGDSTVSSILGAKKTTRAETSKKKKKINHLLNRLF